MHVLLQAVPWRGTERLMIVACAALSMYLGYRLFIFDVKDGVSKLNAQVQWVKIAFSGVGPGLFFMAFGAIVLIVALMTGGASDQHGGSHSGLGAPEIIPDTEPTNLPIAAASPSTSQPAKIGHPAQGQQVSATTRHPAGPPETLESRLNAPPDHGER
jgi:hypothetical protein